MPALSGSKNHNWLGGKSKCIDCSKLLYSRFTKPKRCKDCYIKFIAISPENSPKWKGVGKKPASCVDCNIPIYRYQQRCMPCSAIHRRGKNSGMYKEKLTNYKHLHVVISNMLGKPDTCEFCKKTGLKGNSIQWANKTGKYLREPTDWLRLCSSCHRTYDLKNGLLNVWKKTGLN